MILQYKDYPLPLVNCKYFNVLNVENAKFYFELLNDIYSDLHCASSNLFLSQDGKEVDKNKCLEWINSLWNLELNDRTHLSQLSKRIAKMLFDKNLDSQIINLWLQIEEVIGNELFMEDGIETSDDLPTLDKIVSLAGVRYVDILKANPLERICDYVLVNASYMNKKIFIFDSQLMFFKEKEIMLIKEFFENEKLYSLFVEYNFSTDNPLIEKSIRTVDQDLCWI